jgi:hypothetical protein
MGPPTIHERSSAGHGLSSNSPSSYVSGSRPISPIHEFAPSQQAQSQQQGHPHQPNSVHLSHVHRSQAHQRLVSAQPILSRPYHAVEQDIYATAANQGFLNNSNNGLFQEMPPGYDSGHQFGAPTSIPTDMMSNNNDDLTRLLELSEPNYSIDDDANSMTFGSAPNNNQNNSDTT